MNIRPIEEFASFAEKGLVLLWNICMSESRALASSHIVVLQNNVRQVIFRAVQVFPLPVPVT